MVLVATDAFKSVEVNGKSGVIRADEGDMIEFATEVGEVKVGSVTKITGKGEKTKFQIMPKGSECEEIWSVISMAEGSLKVVE